VTLQQLHERLMVWATAEPRKEDVLQARRIHFERRGEPHDEDRSYEVRLNAMLDFYLYDFEPSRGGGTTFSRFLEAEGSTFAKDDLAAFQELAKNVHGLFEVRKIADGKVRLRDVFTGDDVDVTERRNTAGLEKGDLLEARLLPYGGNLFFSGAFLYHPREARKHVLAEVKRLKKQSGRGGAPEVPVFLDQLARMAMKLERYRNVRLESIYDFLADSRTMTPRPVKS
jgi:hypothetical protein